MFQENEKIHNMKTRTTEKYKVDHAHTERLRKSSIIYMQHLLNEDELKSDKAIRKIHKILNHKSKEQMHYAFRNAGKLDEEKRKKINEIVDKCEICKKNSKSKSKLAVAIPKATDFNSTVAIYVKVA